MRRSSHKWLILAAGALLSSGAFAEGSVFLREWLKEQEREQIEMLALRPEADLASLSLQSASTGGG
jgi:hypothetical protein